MGKATSLASLKPRLIASKGTARPAMRAGNSTDYAALAESQAELGWNDLGDEAPLAVRQIGPAALRDDLPCDHRLAFTLRLDGERHLKLRLASAIGKRSAQSLVTEALDRFLEDIPQLDQLARDAGRVAPKG